MFAVCMKLGEASAEEEDEHDQAAERQETMLCAREAVGRGFRRGFCNRAHCNTPSAAPGAARDAAALRGQMHDLLLRGAGGQEAGQAALAHDGDAMADPQHFGKLRRDHDDCLAARRQIVQQPIDLAFRADVDAARRLVENQHVAVAQKPFGDDDLLLVAARKQPHLLPVGRRLDGKQIDVSRRRVVHLALLVEKAARTGEARHARHRDVVADVHADDEPELLAVLRQVADAGVARRPAAGGCRPCGRERRPRRPRSDRRRKWRAPPRCGRHPSARRSRESRPCAARS